MRVFGVPRCRVRKNYSYCTRMTKTRSERQRTSEYPPQQQRQQAKQREVSYFTRLKVISLASQLE